MRRHLGLLEPRLVRANRKRLGLNQSQLAELVGCSAEWLSRLEKDRLIQSRVHDRFLRLVFEHHVVRRDLARLAAGDSTIGIECRLPNAAMPVLPLEPDFGVYSSRRFTAERSSSLPALRFSTRGEPFAPLASTNELGQAA
jgi:transcriptional regulator with XRE-family HTH domain